MGYVSNKSPARKEVACCGVLGGTPRAGGWTRAIRVRPAFTSCDSLFASRAAVITAFHPEPMVRRPAISWDQRNLGRDLDLSDIAQPAIELNGARGDPGRHHLLEFGQVFHTKVVNFLVAP